METRKKRKSNFAVDIFLDGSSLEDPLESYT